MPFRVKNLFHYQSSNPAIIVTGLMSWAPNKVGIIWFHQEVYPIIKRTIPKIKLYLIGPNPESDILSIQRQDSSVTVTGEVSSLEPFYSIANVLVAPILFGSGIRIKILHAMSKGIPVVSTTIGSEGITSLNRRSIAIADDPSKFALEVVKVIKNKPLALKFSQNGRQLIRRHYSNQQAKLIIASCINS